jgi:hypothetical protein
LLYINLVKQFTWENITMKLILRHQGRGVKQG